MRAERRGTSLLLGAVGRRQDDQLGEFVSAGDDKVKPAVGGFEPRARVRSIRVFTGPIQLGSLEKSGAGSVRGRCGERASGFAPRECRKSAWGASLPALLKVGSRGRCRCGPERESMCGKIGSPFWSNVLGARTGMQTQQQVDAVVGRRVDRPGARWYRSGPLRPGSRARVELPSAPSIYSRKFSP